MVLFLSAFLLSVHAGIFDGFFTPTARPFIIQTDANFSLGNLGDLNDVVLTGEANNEIIIFDSATQTWINAINPSAGGGGRTYTGISPIVTDNDFNQIGLNVLSTSDWNGLFDGLNSDEFGRLAFDNNFTADNNFSRLQVDNFFGDISGATGYTLDQAYDAEPGVFRRVKVDDQTLIFDVNKIAIGDEPPIDINFNMPYYECTNGEASSCTHPEGTSGAINFNLMPDGNLNFHPVSRVRFLLAPQLDAHLETAELLIDILPPVDGLGEGAGSAFFRIRSREPIDGNLVDIFVVGNKIDEVLIPENEFPATVASRGWRPTDDNSFNLGEQNFRWRDLFLAGTIRGQGESASSEFVFQLSGTTGNFDTIGDGNYNDFLVRLDLNNNASGSDANFNNLEADNIFGNFLGSIGDSSDGNNLYVRLNPDVGQVISGALDLNHLDGHTFLGHTFFIGDEDDEVVLIQAALDQTEHIFSITGPEGQHILTILPDGETDLNFVGSQDEGHALHIDIDANGFANISGLEIDYVSGELGLEEEVQVILISIDQNLTLSGQIDGIQIVATEGDANIHFAEIGILIDPITQLSGTFGAMDSAFDAGVDRLSEFISEGSDIAMFVNDDDNVLIGNTEKFQEIEFLLDTKASGAGIKPVFEHSTGVGAFSTFTPTDTTEGMRKNGVVVWDLELIPDWEVGANNEFLIRITRTRNNLTTVPIEDKVLIAVATEFFWNAEGSLFVNDINAGSYAGDGSGLTGLYRLDGSLGLTADLNLQSNEINFLDDKKLFFGTDKDFQIYYRTTDSDNQLVFEALSSGDTVKSFQFIGDDSSTDHGTDWNLETGSGTSGQDGGDIRLTTGNTDTGQAGIIFLRTGTASGAGVDGYVNLFGSSIFAIRDLTQTFFSPGVGQTTFDLNALFLGDLNNLLGQANIFDGNIVNLIPNGVAYPYSDLNFNAITAGCADAEFLGGDGTCQTAGGGTDQNTVRYLYIESPEATDDFPIAFIEVASTIQKVYSETDQNELAFNIEIRSFGSASATGTDTMTIDLNATADGNTSTTFTDATVEAESWLHYVASEVNGTPTKIWVAITYKGD